MAGWLTLGWSVLFQAWDDGIDVGPGRPDLWAVVEGSPMVDLNGARVAQLEVLPGIGPVLAQRIVRYRLLHGPFLSVSDLAHIAGIGPSLVEKLRGRVRLCPPHGCNVGVLPRPLPPPNRRAILKMDAGRR